MMAASSSRPMRKMLGSGSLLALSTAAILAATHQTASAEVVEIGDVPLGSVQSEERLVKGKSRAVPVELPSGPDGLATFGWGTPFASSAAPVRYPSLVAHLSGPGMAFREIKMERDYGAVVDARGDVYLWGRGITDGDESKGGLKRCLQGLKITALAPTPNKLYALSSGGTIYALPTTTALQRTTEAESIILRVLDPLRLFHSRPQPVDFVALTPTGSTLKSTTFTSFAAGQSHLLALSKSGAVWGHAVNEKANWFGQLADLSDIGGEAGVLEAQDSIDWTTRHREAGLQITKTVDPFIRSYLPAVTKTVDAAQGLSPLPRTTARGLKPAEDIHWSSTIHPIPALEDVQIPVSQVAVTTNASYLLLANQRVLSFGHNAFGQLGLGALKNSANIRLPTEVILPSGKTCTRITGGGDVVYFETKSETGGAEVYAGGMGQWGGLGNGSWSQGQASLVRVKNISGLSEFSESLNRLEAIPVDRLSVSPTWFTIATLATSGGRDVLVWGSNANSQLANLKKSNAAVPANMGNLPAADPAVGARMVLHERPSVEVRDLEGHKVGKRSVRQAAEAGWGGAAVYWRVD